MAANLASGRQSCHANVLISIPRKLRIGLGPSILWMATGKPSMLHTSRAVLRALAHSNRGIGSRLGNVGRC